MVINVYKNNHLITIILTGIFLFILLFSGVYFLILPILLNNLQLYIPCIPFTILTVFLVLFIFYKELLVFIKTHGEFILTEDSIIQRKFKKEIIIKYDEITEVIYELKLLKIKSNDKEMIFIKDKKYFLELYKILYDRCIKINKKDIIEYSKLDFPIDFNWNNSKKIILDSTTITINDNTIYTKENIKDLLLLYMPSHPKGVINIFIKFNNNKVLMINESDINFSIIYLYDFINKNYKDY
ncbi:MAG: hypothetical protein A2086_06685 [Spirochaetes bacterium GWD1_27_9]|nr:MAG: hypothetical protein A2Z98_00540 [Spirochaetes bacterium GWB1_27_13]OHD20055.1 MAG: hypothetical protein A2Y34_08095 [Spirochaetes bacterium GWC1_27_15]OHD41325.1 MAG: hypothetical protein A2086_06685 [Spirochaetes bacterium GWD1_27_9]